MSHDEIPRRITLVRSAETDWELQGRIHRNGDKKNAISVEGAWPSLAEALCPDVRATSVYYHVAKWIADETRPAVREQLQVALSKIS